MYIIITIIFIIIYFIITVLITRTNYYHKIYLEFVAEVWASGLGNPQLLGVLDGNFDFQHYYSCKSI